MSAREVPVPLCHYLSHISGFFWQRVLWKVRIYKSHSVSLVYGLLQLRHLAEGKRRASGLMSAEVHPLQ